MQQQDPWRLYHSGSDSRSQLGHDLFGNLPVVVCVLHGGSSSDSYQTASPSGRSGVSFSQPGALAMTTPTGDQSAWGGGISVNQVQGSSQRSVATC